MESPTRISITQQPLPHPPTCATARKSNDFICASPEFEFWMLRNPSFPLPNLHSADELFQDGILRPLHHLHIHHTPPPNPVTDPHPNPHPPISPTPEPSNSIALTSSKIWQDMFKKPSTATANHQVDKDSNREKKKKKKKGGSTTLNTAEALSIINIWPFSRSRSAGNNGSRGRMSSGTRKASSAPCSRSNSGGESKTRKWAASPSRSGGVHVGRSSPVLQVRRTCKSDRCGRSRTSSIPTTSGDGNKGRVLNFNICIGHGHHMTCRSDENSKGGGGRREGYGGWRSVGSGNNVFNLRSMFSAKKVH